MIAFKNMLKPQTCGVLRITRKMDWLVCFDDRTMRN